MALQFTVREKYLYGWLSEVVEDKDLSGQDIGRETEFILEAFQQDLHSIVEKLKDEPEWGM